MADWLDYVPAAPTQVSFVGGRECPDCGKKDTTLYGLMYDDRTLRCARCHDDWFYRDSPPEVRAKAEQHVADVLRWMVTGVVPDRG